MIQPQTLRTKAGEAQVLEGKKGTRLFILPGTFVDAQGNPVQGAVDIRLAEATKAADMILSNLTTMSGNTLLQTGGMLYMDFSQKGEKVYINPEQPLYTELPTPRRQPGMQLYQGVRDAEGNMDWQNPTPLPNYLAPLEDGLQEYYPYRFKDYVADNLSFLKEETLSKRLLDSLYFEVVGGYAAKNPANTKTDLDLWEPIGETDSSSTPYGIDPASIKALLDPRFSQTFLNTREFEQRLRRIFNSCNQQVLDIYVNNLDKPLWRCDQMAAEIPMYNDLNTIFMELSEEKAGIVPGQEALASLLADYHSRRTQALREEYRAKRNAALESDSLLVLQKKLREQSYGFPVLNEGWYNVDKPIDLPADRYKVRVDSKFITSGNLTDKSLESSHGYALITDYTGQGLIRLKKEKENEFTMSNYSLTKETTTQVIILAYSEEKIWFAATKMEASDTLAHLQMELITRTELDKRLNRYKAYEDFAQLKIDEQLQATNYQAKKRREFEWKLILTGLPCSELLF